MRRVEKVLQQYQELKEFYTERDQRMMKVKDIRAGKMSNVAPGWLPESGEFTEPIIANTIDVAARDMAEMIAPLPFRKPPHYHFSQKIFRVILYIQT